MNIGRTDAGMDPPAPRPGQSPAASLDIDRDGPGEGANSGSGNFGRDPLDGRGVLGGGAGIAGFNHVHVQCRELPGDGEFLAAAQACSGSLFAIAQGGVEYGNFL